MADTARDAALRTLPFVAMWLVAVSFSGGMSWEARAEVAAECYVKGDTWQATVLATRAKLQPLEGEQFDAAFKAAWRQMEKDFPIPCDWLLQDLGKRAIECFRGADGRPCMQTLLEEVGKELTEDAKAIRQRIAALKAENPPPADVRWWSLYVEAAGQRRATRLRTVLAAAPRILFLKHKNLHGSHYAYTEAQSDAQNERNYKPKSALCVLEMQGIYGLQKTLIDDPEGVIRDPDISFDGKRALFAWKQSDRLDDYHLHELDLETLRTRQITRGLGFADYEGIYLPDGDIVFNSTRCVQTVDCWWTEVSNLYTCDADGRYLRRLGFDQVHTVHPAVLDDGRVVYTRWDYNDRGQVFPQGLFQMNPDGSGQTEFYGNNSWFPTTIAHTRGIPGTGRVLAIFCGHHSAQAGKLGVVDPSLGRQENTGAQLAGPLRATRAERIDSYGQNGALFQYPFPLTDRECVVAHAPFGWNTSERRRGDADFGLYWFDVADGRRELLVADPAMPCQQPVPVVARTPPRSFPSTVDYRKADGTVYVRDVYEGPGLAGVPRGSIRRIRVVAIDYRAAGVGSNSSGGPGGGALISTPVAIGNGTWDVKIVLGETPVEADGSAFFTVPARTPLYFQMVDERGFVAQTMRSWVTLQPGENRACVGCHEDKNGAPAEAFGPGRALRAGPRALEPFHGPPRGFSFAREIQPILDRHCVRCHDDRSALAARWSEGGGAKEKGRRERDAAAAGTGNVEPGTRNPEPGLRRAFSLLGDPVEDRHARRFWSDAYLALTHARPDRRGEGDSFRGTFDAPVLNWPGSQSVPSMLPPYFAGAARSRLFEDLARGHGAVKMSRGERDLLACWVDLYVPFCGGYEESAAWSDGEREKYRRYLEKRRGMEALERANIAELMGAGVAPPGVAGP